MSSGGLSVRPGPVALPEARGAQLRRVQRRLLQRAGREELDSDRAGFVCALVCGSCGQLGWSEDAGGAHPHRRDAEAAPMLQPCTHCGVQSWIDLAHEPTALALRSGEEGATHSVRSGRLRILYNCLLGLGIGGILGLGVGGLLGLETIGSAIVLLTIATLASALGGLLTYRQDQRLRPDAPTLPARWAMALPPTGSLQPTARGRANALTESLRAPLSGRPCLAYEVGARHDERADAGAATWALLEQHVAEIEVDGRAVDPINTHLDLRRERLGAMTELDLDPAARVYLRQRGFAEPNAPLQLYESIIAPDAVVELLESDRGATLRLAGDASR